MSDEPLDNIDFVCSEHAAKPNPLFYGKKPLRWFAAKHVKLGFPTGMTAPQTEHMWVRVVGRAKRGTGHELFGVLDNNPVCCRDVVCGDSVAFNRNEVEDHYPKHGTFIVKHGRKTIAEGDFAGEQVRITKGLGESVQGPFTDAVRLLLTGRAKLNQRNELIVKYDAVTYKLQIVFI